MSVLILGSLIRIISWYLSAEKWKNRKYGIAARFDDRKILEQRYLDDYDIKVSEQATKSEANYYIQGGGEL